MFFQDEIDESKYKPIFTSRFILPKIPKIKKSPNPKIRKSNNKMPK